MIRAVLLAAALAPAVASGALAYDLPAYEPAARACPRMGPGFIEVPGTTTCIRIGGRVAVEAGTSSRRIDRDRIAGFGTRATVTMESRTDTELGPFRAVWRARVLSNGDIR